VTGSFRYCPKHTSCVLVHSLATTSRVRRLQEMKEQSSNPNVSPHTRDGPNDRPCSDVFKPRDSEHKRGPERRDSGHRDSGHRDSEHRGSGYRGPGRRDSRHKGCVLYRNGYRDQPSRNWHRPNMVASNHDAIVNNHDRAATTPCVLHQDLRSLNNYIKATVINDALDEITTLPEPRNMIDIGSGRGGDIQKISIAVTDGKISQYTGCDIAQAAVDEATGRLAGKPKFVRDRMEYQLSDALKLLDDTRDASIVSGMMVANYLCPDTAALDKLLLAAERALRVGGVMVLTFLDWGAVEEVYKAGLDVPFITHDSCGAYKYNLPGLVNNVPEFPLRMDQVCERAMRKTSLIPVEHGTNPDLYSAFCARTDSASVQMRTRMLSRLSDTLDADTTMRFGLYAGVLLRKMG
jgi:SAM-dependent methyltransferase